MVGQVKLNLAVADPARFEPALEEAKKIGLEVSQSFADLGIASGSISEQKYSSLLRIEGMSVEADRKVGIPINP